MNFDPTTHAVLLRPMGELDIQAKYRFVPGKRGGSALTGELEMITPSAQITKAVYHIESGKQLTLVYRDGQGGTETEYFQKMSPAEEAAEIQRLKAILNALPATLDR